MGVSLSFKNSKLNISGGFISTGIAKVEHNLGHTKYNVFTQKRHHADEITVTGIYATSFTVEVRRNGTLISSDFDFNIIGNNY